MTYINPHSTMKAGTSVEFDQGLRDFFLGVYNRMALGVGLTGFVAAIIASNPILSSFLLSGPVFVISLILPFVLLIALMFTMKNGSTITCSTLYWVYCAVMGLSLSVVFMAYTATSIATAFLGATSLFAGMSLYGYLTKRDLTSFGAFLFAGLFALIVASVINLFVGSTVLQMALSVIGILVFLGLTAYDTQKLKDNYYIARQAGGTQLQKAAIIGSIELYLDFINIFLNLLQLFGSSND